MADTVVSTLYPPMIETFQPAFLCQDSANVTFSLSSFNSIDEINFIHISISDNRNNENLLPNFKEWDVRFWKNQPPQGNEQSGVQEYGIFNGILCLPMPTFTNTVGRVTKGWITYDADRDKYMISIPPFLLDYGYEDNDNSLTTTTDNTESTNEGQTEENNKIWKNNRYYKIQIRFDSSPNSVIYQLIANIEEWPPDQFSGDWMMSNSSSDFWADYMYQYRSYFSEWSTVTLIKPIAPIHVGFNKLEDGALSINRGFFRLAGIVDFDNYYYDDNNIVTVPVELPEEEHLKSYEVNVYHKDGDNLYAELVFSSGVIYAVPNYTDYRYGINTLLDLNDISVDSNPDKNYYTIVVGILTTNDYSQTEERYLQVKAFNDKYFTNKSTYYWNDYPIKEKTIPDPEDPEDTITISLDKQIYVNQEDGYAKINFQYIHKIGDDGEEAPSLPPGTFYFFRTSSKDNWKSREIIYLYKWTAASAQVPEISFEDYTICSLYQYQYHVQFENEAGDWTMIHSSDKIYPKFYDMLLMRQNRQIAIRYNGQVISWKPTVNRQKVDTLGGKYPKFVENAVMNYKTYQINGLISAEGDFNRKFMNEFDGYWEDSITFKYYYNEDMAKYNTELDGQYLIRNDTAPDGEFGWNPAHNMNEYENDIYKRDYPNQTFDEIESGLQFLNSKYDKTTNYNEEFGSTSSDPIDKRIYQIHDLYPHDNWYWERLFREELVNWLNDGEPKLYRSMPEGNIAVILTDVNLTPNTQLGRRLYNFSATLYEVGDGYSLEDLDNLGIINIPKVNAVYIGTSGAPGESDGGTSGAVVWKTGLGQIKKSAGWGGAIVNSNSNIKDDEDNNNWEKFTIANRIQETLYTGQGRDHTIGSSNGISLSNIQIQFTSSPHYYHYDGKNWIRLDETTGIDIPTITENTKSEKLYKERNQKNTYTPDGDSLWLGYVINIQENSQNTLYPIFINEKGYYQIPNNISVSEILFESDDEAILNYQYQYIETMSASSESTTQTIESSVIGQVSGIFYPDTNITDLINDKYYYKYPDSSERYVQYWRGIELDVTPYAEFYISYKDTSAEESVMYVGRTGVLNLFENTPIDSLRFNGRRMFVVDDSSRQDFLDDWECIIDTDTYTSIDDIKYPQFNRVYTIGEDKFIYYYNGLWYPVTSFTGEPTVINAQVPIEGMINYKADLIRRKVG